MKIVADPQIPQVDRAFAGIADLQFCNGRELTPASLADADALLVRSVTRVDRKLLQGSSIRYVATATSGIDHVDTGYLQETGIGFDSAHGSNARSVAEYVLSALFVLAEQQQFNLFSKTVGIIGAGKVGSVLSCMLSALGISCLLNDPPLQEISGDSKYRSLEEALSADIISLHVPLTKSGRYSTLNLINTNTLSQMKADAVLVNTSRGTVVDEAALMQSNHARGKRAILDVWENEPDINTLTLSGIAIGTPHIAGYSLDARMRATSMVHEGLCRFFGVENDWSCSGDWQDLNRLSLTFSDSLTDEDIITMAVLSHYDVRSDAASLRRLLEVDEDKRGYFFDQLRKNYPVRREFAATSIQLPQGRQAVAGQLRAAGFSVPEMVA